MFRLAGSSWQLAARIWSLVAPAPARAGREPVGLHGDSDGAPATFKFYRYRRGHRFGPHVDTAHKGPGGAGEEGRRGWGSS
eukprot:scaffold15380_cov117-Isochrysis_galbana.AAC.1